MGAWCLLFPALKHHLIFVRYRRQSLVSQKNTAQNGIVV